MKFGSFVDMNLYDSSVLIVLTSMICQSLSDMIFDTNKLFATSTGIDPFQPVRFIGLNLIEHMINVDRRDHHCKMRLDLFTS
jgi:hypothetical protein